MFRTRFWDVVALAAAGFMLGAGLAMLLLQPPHLAPRPVHMVVSVVRVL